MPRRIMKGKLQNCRDQSRGSYVIVAPFARRDTTSLPHHLDHHSFFPLPIELAVENLLPGSEVEFAFSDGDDDLVVEEDAF